MSWFEIKCNTVHQIVLACCLLALVSFASAEEVKPNSELTDETGDVQVADQDAGEWYGRGYYGSRHYYNPYGYNANDYGGHHYGHWRGRRSAAAALVDQKADDSSYYPGYYRGSYYRPYSYYSRHYYPSSSYSYRYY